MTQGRSEWCLAAELRCGAGPFHALYNAHFLIPLVMFFFLFIAVIKNKRLHHFVRYNAMQALMMDIMAIFPAIVNHYIPGEIFWTPIGDMLVATYFLTMATAVVWCLIATMCGRYADLPLVSEAVYMQVWQMEML